MRLLCAIVLGALTLSAQVSLTSLGTPVTQDFNTLASSGTSNSVPTGWAFLESGTNANLVYSAGTGSINTGDTYSFGTSGSTERAFGGLLSGSLVPAVGASFTNNTGSTITSLTISYTGEQWRCGATGRGADRLDFQYSLNATALNNGAWIDVNALDFSSPNVSGVGPLDGNSATNRASLSFTITGLSIPNGATFWIRWQDFNVSNADDGLAVDDFSLTPQAGAVLPTLSINDVSQNEGNSGVTTFTFTVSLSSPAGAGGVTFDIATADGTATAPSDYTARSLTGQTIPEGNSTATFDVLINGDTTNESSETFFVNVTNIVGAAVGDAQGLGTIVNDDTPPPSCSPTTTISAIQGTGTSSPLAGQTVTVQGIATALRTNGFFFQDPLGDANAATSDGIFVFTNSTPPASAVVGASLCVTGTVTEFLSSSAISGNTLTEITNPVIVQLSTGNPLPAPVVLTSADTSTSATAFSLEKYEAMRVQADLTVVAPTDGNVSEANATATSTGIFYGVLSGIARPFREPGIEFNTALPVPNAPRFDGNPEKIRVASGILAGSTRFDVAAGQTVSALVGPLDVFAGEYSLLNEAGSGIVGGTPDYPAVTPAGANELTVASFNLERFYDTTNDPAVDDVALTATAFNNRLNKASLFIRNQLQAPDILGVVEVENLSTLQALATKISTDSGGAIAYNAFLVEGNDIGGIDVGFLVKSPKVTVNSVTQYNKNETFVSYQGVETLNDRPPLVLDATVQGLPVIVIVNHLRSLNGVDAQTDAGGRVRLKRQKQAESLAALVQSFQAANPAANIIVAGDFNAFQFNDGYVDVLGTIKGAPAPADQVQIGTSVDLVNPDLTNLVETLPSPGQRYSYLFGGDAQVLDHVLVNSNMAARAVRLAYARGNADAPETARNDANTAFRISDHDAPVAYFTLPPPVVNINAQTSITTTGLLYSRLTRTYNGSVTVTNTSGVTINGPVNLVYRNLPAGVTLANATGNYEGAPSRLVTAGSLAPGQSITVSVSFNNPANVPITYSIDRLAGTF